MNDKTMTIDQVHERLESVKSTEKYAYLSDVEFSSEGLTFTETGETFELDEWGFIKLGRYFGIPKSYVKKMTSDLLLKNLEFWREENEHVQTRFFFWNGELELVSDIDDKLIQPKHALRALGTLVGSNTFISELMFDPDRFYITFIFNDSKREIESNGEYYNISGGVQILQHYNTTEPIVVKTVLYREDDGTTLTFFDKDDRVKLTRNTMEGVLDDLHTSATTVYRNLDYHLNLYYETSQSLVKGSLSSFIRQVTNGTGVGNRAVNHMAETLINTYQDKSNPPTLFDVIQVVTSTAQQTQGLEGKTNLQTLAGSLTTHYDHVTEPCPSCNRVEL